MSSSLLESTKSHQRGGTGIMSNQYEDLQLKAEMAMGTHQRERQEMHSIARNKSEVQLVRQQCQG